MGEAANVVKRLNDHLFMTLKIVGRDKDFIISPNISRGWEAADKDVADGSHNSLRAVLEQSRGPDTYDSSLSKDSNALPPALSQFHKVANSLLTSVWGWRLVGRAASSSDAPPLAASDQHAKDPAVAGSGTDLSTPEENFLNQIEEIGAAEEWAATPHEEKGAVLAAAIELNTHMCEDRDDATEWDAQRLEDEDNERNNPTATSK